MKENWIKKIIELLNEAIRNWLDFQWYDILKIEYYSETDIRAYYDKTARAYYNITYEDIISKRAGFIKRLVENDKIDLWKIKKLYRKSNEHSIHTYPIMYKYTYDESLLMQLALSDSPINDLISYLR